jgi:hypothetical protein
MAEKKLHASIVLGGSISSSLKTAFGTAEGGLKKIGTQITALTKRQDLLGKSIQTFGRMGKNVSGMRAEYARLTLQVDKLKTAQTRLNAAVKQHARLMEMAGKLQTAGGYMTGAGIAGVTGAYMFGIREAKNYQTEMARLRALGMGNAVNSDALAFLRQMKTFGTSRTENLTLMRDALSVFGDVEHAKMALPMLAKMKFGNEALYGSEEGAENEQKFIDMMKVVELRGGTKNQTEFNKQSNMVQQVLAATGGRVGPDEWRALISTGGLAAKSMRDDAFYYQLEPLVQEMGGKRVGTALMSAYSNLYQGRTTKRAIDNLQKFGLIADPSKLVHAKGGREYMNPGALKGAELFRQSQFEWVQKVLVPTLAKHGMTSKDQVLDAIGEIFTNRTAANLIATMYLQKTQIEKDERLSRGADNIDKMSAEGENTVRGRELRARARLHNAELAFGKAMIPIYTTLIDKAAAFLEVITKFMQAHPRMAKAIAIGFVSLAGALTVLGPLLMGIGGMLSAYAGYTLLVGKFGGMWPMVSRMIGMVVTPLRLVGNALLWVGRLFLANPWMLALAAIALAAVEIYRHWDGVKAFFEQLWLDLKRIFGDAIAIIIDLLTLNLPKAFQDLKHAFSDLGKFADDVFNGMASAATTVIDDVLKAVGLINDQKRAQEVGKKFADQEAALRDKSIADVFKGAISAPMLGIPQMVQAWKNAKALKQSELSATAAAAAPTIPPMAGGSGNASAPVTIHQQNTFNVSQQPGESSDAFAKRLAQQLQQQNAVAQRGALGDGAY